MPPHVCEPDLTRVLVVGTSAAGKTTLSRHLARCTGLPMVELDALFWGPDWTPQPRAVFEARVDQAAAGERWVMDGNYGGVRHRLWPRATTIVWLNYSKPRVLWRGLRRTVSRCLSRERLWHGNRESVGRAFFSRDSILWWIHTTHARRRRELTALRASGPYAAVPWLEFRRPAEAERWLATLASPARAGRGGVRVA